MALRLLFHEPDTFLSSSSFAEDHGGHRIVLEVVEDVGGALLARYSK